MDKNEILEKSRRENLDEDERARRLRIQGNAFSLIFAVVVGGVLILYNIGQGLPSGGILSVLSAALLGQRVYCLIKERTLVHFILALFFFLILLLNLIEYFTQRY